MANPLYGQNKFDSFQDSGEFLTVQCVLGTATSNDVYLVVPKACKITTVYSCINQALSTADETIAVKSAQGTLGTITITQSGSAAADIDSISPSSSNILAAGDYLHLDIGGENGTAAECYVTIVCKPS
tara:strand:+ start:795 stop:1178 length:384 start_codon:yes stop_codon:yes gene_type:complete